MDARQTLADREARLAGHGREGVRLAERDAGYGAHVLGRLHLEAAAPPDDVWTAIPWTWAVVLGGPSPGGGAMRDAVAAAASILRLWCEGDEPVSALQASWQRAASSQLALGSTLRSHPFADLRSWSIRPRSVA